MKLTKKLVSLLIVALILVGCGTNNNSSQETLKVFSWGEYIDKAVITDFEKENNVRVIYETFDSNESMYTKLSSGANYDILVPSDYMIQRLIEEEMLQKIDLTKIPNVSNLMDTAINKEYDKNMEYSVPYFWGTVGILYNKEKVDPQTVESKGWEIYKDTEYAGNLFFYDSERDAFMVALKALGYSVNSEDEKELEAAYNWLLELSKTMNPVFVDDSVIDSMVNGNKDIANIYSGDATYIMSENEDMAYFVPKEGSNIWQDAMVIPKNAENVELAHKWMNYMLEHDVALANTIEVGYSTPVKAVYDEVTGPGGDYEGYNSYLNDNNPNNEEYKYNAKTKEIISEYWTKVKGTK